MEGGSSPKLLVVVLFVWAGICGWKTEHILGGQG